jgi:hypothetical protein
MLSPFPHLDQPADDALMWRYVDFTKYVAMLADRCLALTRLDRLGDPFEGAYPRRQAAAAPADGEAYARFDPCVDLRRYVYVSCWYVNPHESAAMWRVYAGPDGLAVRSTPGRLRDALRGETRPLSAGCVRYLDYNEETMPGEQGLMPFLCKRRSFEFEREYRILHYDEPAHDGCRPDPPPAVGMAADLAVLVRDVVVSPTAGDWLVGLVRTVSQRFGLDVPVTRSDLDRGPVY